MDTTVPHIRFNPEGVCSYCSLHDRMEKSQRHLHGSINQLAERIGKAGKGLDYDCIVGVSGGTDSTYCLYVIKQLGLRPLAVHFDNGWVSDTAKANIERIEQRLNLAVRRVTVDWADLQIGYRACLEASIPDICMPCEIGGYSAIYSVAAELGVRFIILGHSYRTEGINPLLWHYVDGRYFADVLKKHAADKQPKCQYNRMNLLPFVNFAVRHGIRTIQLPLYMQSYRDKDIRETLSQELGWVYGGHHHFDCYYKPFVSTLHGTKFNADLRKVSLSAQVRTGEISRNEALAALNKPSGATHAETEYCLNRLGISREDFAAILQSAVRSFRDYRTYYSLISRIRLPLKVMSRMGIFPETTYEKMFES